MSARSPNWVSKSNLADYLRCPYAFYMVDQGLIPFTDAVTAPQARLIAEGIDFQAHIEASIPGRTIAPSDLAMVFATESIELHNPPVLENAALEIYGKPDAIVTAQGAVFPVEIKSHKDVQRSDELELAFYWLLLEPFRSRPVSPLGYLDLRRDERVERVAIEIRPDRFDQVRDLLKEIRNARRNGVQPEICKCGLCSGVMREDIRKSVFARKSLSLIWGIGPAYARTLKECDITTYEELAATDSATIFKCLRAQGHCVSQTQIDVWKHHATSYAEDRPVVFGADLALEDQFLVLDLEYTTPGGFIWLIGVGLVGLGGVAFVNFWSETLAEEADNLRRLVEIVAKNPFVGVVTWNGTGADLPQLRKAVQRHNLGAALDEVEARHLDAYLHAMKSVRFPMPELGLKQVAGFFGLRRGGRISGGLEANILYQSCRSSLDEAKRNAMKNDLIEYNREDVESLAAVARRLASLKRDTDNYRQPGDSAARATAL